MLDGPMLQNTPKSGQRTGYNGARKHKDSKAYIAVDMLGHLLSVLFTPANEQERAQVGDGADMCRK
ncbi:transposase [Hymenobacter amundsenii]|nr:transposase [Hymenobacter amundsenii]